jgi:hypothetical protein
MAQGKSKTYLVYTSMAYILLFLCAGDNSEPRLEERPAAGRPTTVGTPTVRPWLLCLSPSLSGAMARWLRPE